MCRAFEEWQEECIQKGIATGIQQGIQTGITQGEIMGTLKTYKKFSVSKDTFKVSNFRIVGKQFFRN